MTLRNMHLAHDCSQARLMLHANKNILSWGSTIELSNKIITSSNSNVKSQEDCNTTQFYATSPINGCSLCLYIDCNLATLRQFFLDGCLWVLLFRCWPLINVCTVLGRSCRDMPITKFREDCFWPLKGGVEHLLLLFYSDIILDPISKIDEEI